MSNNSLTHAKQGLLQKHITSPLLFEQMCPNVILNYDAYTLEKCCFCNSIYSNTNVPKCLPCSHTICGRCILEKMGNNTVCCGICQTEYQYLIESNGFLIGSDKNVKVFNDYDELINTNDQAHVNIHVILSEESPKWMNPLTMFLKDVKNGDVKIVNKDSVPKSVMGREFSYKCPSIRSDEKLDEVSQSELCQAARNLDLELAKTDIYVDKFKRSVDTIIFEAKKRDYRLDMGHDVESITELLEAIKVYQPHQVPLKEGKSQRSSYSKKKIENSRNACKSIIQCNDSFDRINRKGIKKPFFKNIFMTLRLPVEQFIPYSYFKIKEKDYLICKNDKHAYIMDGCYTRIGYSDASFDFHKRFRVCFKCYEKHSSKYSSYENIISVPASDSLESMSTHFCPAYLVGMCLKHSIMYKIRYPSINIFSIVDKVVIESQYQNNKSKISMLMLTLMRSQYAMAFDKLKVVAR